MSSDKNAMIACICEEACGVFLKPEAFKKILKAFAKKMATKFHHPHDGREMSYMETINAQAMKYRDAIEKKAPLYEPVLWH